MGSGALSRSFRILCVSALCLCVFMQILGVPTSMWNLEGSEDLFQGPILEDLSIPTLKEHFTPVRWGAYPCSTSHVVRDMLLEGLLFRPPCSII